MGELLRDSDILRRRGIVEIAGVNASVADYCRHWEQRAEKAESELAALRQPIEAAPTDGRRILCASTSVFIVRHVDDSALWLDDNGAFRDPSHWQPLPELPDV